MVCFVRTLRSQVDPEKSLATNRIKPISAKAMPKRERDRPVVLVGSPAAGPRQRGHRTGEAAPRQLDGKPAAERVADDVCLGDALGTQGRDHLVGQPCHGGIAAAGVLGAAMVPGQSQGDHPMVRLEGGNERLPDFPGIAPAVQ